MKAVLLAAGKGTRLFPITEKISKQMIPIAGKPILQYVLEELIECGFDNFCIVTNYLEDQIKDYFGTSFKNTQIHYVTQKKLLGTADATNAAKDFVGNDSFLLYLTDTIIPERLEKIINNMLTASDMAILSSYISPDKIQSVGSVEIEQNLVKQISEKSSNNNNLAWAGLAFFKDNFIFKIIENLKPSDRGELEITDAMNLCLEKNKKIINFMCDSFIDSGTPKGMADMSKYILKNHTNAKSFSKNQQFVYIGKNCKISSTAKLGPYVSIGNNAQIGENVVIKNSIILDDTKIKNNSDINNKIILRNLELDLQNY